MVNENVVKIFKQCEQEFRKWTAERGYQIDCKFIAKRIIEKSIVKLNCASYH